MSEPVVTRFAPSPTGFLHIGGARTALFNWLYAKRFGGKMLLRIEDTDRERSTAAAIAAIIDGLTWLDLSWDGDIVFQFSRAERHRQIAEQLLAEGKAYRCYASPDELTAMREAAVALGLAHLLVTEGLVAPEVAKRARDLDASFRSFVAPFEPGAGEPGKLQCRAYHPSEMYVAASPFSSLMILFSASSTSLCSALMCVVRKASRWGTRKLLVAEKS